MLHGIRCPGSHDGKWPADKLIYPRLYFMSETADPFFEPYDRDEIAYGETPSRPLAAYLQQVGGRGFALDLGAGAGRDTMALAASGYQVTAVDLSQRGLDRVQQRAESMGLSNLVSTQVGDVRSIEIPTNHYSAIVATTVLDHIPSGDAPIVWKRMVDALTDDGFLYAEVHTTEDPGSDQLPGLASDAPVSETASAVITYFRPNQLAQWALESASRLRLLRYEERLEWDYTHGPEHLHGKAMMLAVRAGHHPPWYGQPAAFPKRQ